MCWLILSADMYQYENSLLFQCAGVTLEDKGYCEIDTGVSQSPIDLSFSWPILACHRYIGIGTYACIEHNAEIMAG